MKIAVLNSGDPYNKKGVMNFVWEKVRRLKGYHGADISVDYFILRNHPSCVTAYLLRLVKGYSKLHNGNNKVDDVIDGIPVSYLWVKTTLLDQLRLKIINRNPIPDRYVKKYSLLLSNYDVIVSHTPVTHYLAYYTYKQYGIPYSTTWHGSDINILPHIDKKIVPLLAKIITNARVNFFVSKALLNNSNYIINGGNKEVYYTGPSEQFRKYNKSLRDDLRIKFGCKGQAVVAFVGNIIEVKNVLTLPTIFKYVKELYDGDVIFWIIGNGNLENDVEAALISNNLSYRLWGKIEPNDVPDYMNCIDVLVLPSINEGLPLVLLEVLACGANAVGSKVGGIPEVLGNDNVFALDKDFELNIAKRVLELLKTREIQYVPDCFSWDLSIKREIELYNRIFYGSI